MALIVESGSIVPGAESYCTVAFANTYHASRGNTAWEALDDADDKEPALRRATDYMLQTYRGRWKGYRVSSTQPLNWPREAVVLGDGPNNYGDVVANTIVPLEVKNACAEYALRAVTSQLAADLTRGTLSESVGEISVTYDPASPQYARYRAVDAVLAPYLTSSGSMTRLVRS